MEVIEIMGGDARELPQYQCHKKVWALKIKDIKLEYPTIEMLDKLLKDGEPIDPVGAVITPEKGEYASFTVPRSYVMKHEPQVGGYFVQYQDGYTSFSPAEAFEQGYTRI